MKGLIASTLALLTISASADELQTMHFKPGEDDRSKWILDDGKFKTYELALSEGPSATYEVRDGKIVRESICKDSETPWEQCTRILLVSFANECIMEKITTYCDQYREVRQLVELVAMLKEE